MNDSIAIIGVSFDLPNIKNWNDLKKSLSDNASYISDMPESRLAEIQKVFGSVQMAKAGYLNEIDKFDNEYFGFTERESVRTLPEHRLFLMHAMRAFYHAGYSEASLKGSKTGIFFTASESAYYKYAKVSDLTFSQVDFISGMEGTKLANYLDTRGPVISINTSCSSSLVAINAARQSLNDNECEMAIVGGVKILTLTREATLKNIVHSQKEECKPFDQEADGMMNGEGAIFFVLKRYGEAVKDGDTILAEIRGVGINHGGARISSLTAPSSDAQKDVIIQAWNNAKVDPRQIRYIEAHGTATILGDPIEIEGIKRAFYQSNVSNGNALCGLSSFKGQIGHLDYLSGLAGLLRLVAVLNFKIIPVQANLSTLNKYFNLEGTGLYIPTSNENWPGENGERIGGVSSFGMTGTNVHLVVSQHDAHIPDVYTGNEINYLQISHRNSQGLKEYKKYILEKVIHLDRMEDIHTLCLKLNSIFQPDKENEGIIYSSKESLISSLKSEDSNAATEKVFLLLDLALIEYPKDFITSLFAENVFIKKAWDKYVSLPLESIQNQHAVNVFFQYTIYRYLLEKTANKIKFITSKAGSLLNRLVKSEITVSRIMSEGNNHEEVHHPFDEELLRKYLKDNLAGKEVVIIDFSGKDKNRFDDSGLALNVIAGSFSDYDRFLLYSNIVKTGINPLEVSFSPVFNDTDLPYFSTKRFWPDVQVQSVINTIKNEVKLQSGKDEIRKVVWNSWALVLESNDFKEEEDFFAAGGTSLAALDMIDEIGKKIPGVKISYESMYSHATITQLTELIFSQLTNAAVEKENDVITAGKLSRVDVAVIVRNSWRLILETDDFKNEDNFFEIGGTSLAALDMLDEIQKNIKGAKIAYEEIYSCATISALSDKIFSQLSPVTVTENEVSENFNTEQREDSYNKLLLDISNGSFSKHIPDDILITGGTGFLGMNMIDYLINHTQARLSCLVRKEGNGLAEERFWSIYEKHFKIRDKNRVIIIEGDLYREDLGVENIDHKTDMIFHVAGSPQFVSQKGVEEHINFLGTKNIVDWANKKGVKKLSFVSTIGIAGKKMPAGIEHFYETDTNIGQQCENLIHSASKLKAEEYIHKYYNYKSQIFRIPNIGGRLDDGEFATNLDKNLMWLRLKSLSEMKFYCNELLDRNSGIGLMPVDILARLIAEISFTDMEALNVYHIMQRKYFTNGEVLSSFRKVGISLEPTSYDNFIAYLSDNNHKMNFHEVARKDNQFEYRAEATNEIISRLNLDKVLDFDTQLYLDRLISTNLKTTR